MRFLQQRVNKKLILYSLMITFIIIASLFIRNITLDAATYTSSEAASKAAVSNGWTWDSTRNTWKMHEKCPSTSHDWYLRFSSWSVQPTCAASGVANGYCPSCGFTGSISVAQYAHNTHQVSHDGYIWNKCYDCHYEGRVRAIKYTIVYDKNDSGATGTMTNSSNLSYGTSYNLKSNGFSKQYYNFIGWATSPNGNVVYGNGAPVSNLTQTDGGTVTLYAKWEGVKSKLYVSPYGGTWNGYTDTQVYERPYGTTMNIPVPTRKGYKFVKWIVVFNYGTLTSTTGPATFTFGHDEGSETTLSAEWELQKYTISFDGNGSNSGSLGSITFDQNMLDANATDTESGSIKIPSCTFQKNGHTFTGWNTKADGTGSSYQPGDKYSTLANLKLYAQWKINSSSLSVDPNGGTWNGFTTIKNYEGTYGQQMSIPLPTREGYTFTGWEFGGGSGSITSTTSAATYTFGKRSSLVDVLKATWRENTYTITYYPGTGGIGSAITQTKGATSDVVLFSNPFNKNGHAFVKWNTKADGTGTSYDALSTYSTNANLDLYAIWIIDSRDSTNTKKTAFDTDLDLPNVKVTNVTLTYDTSNDVIVDYGSNTTNVEFDCWTKYSEYANASYAYADYNSTSNVTGNYYDEFGSTNTELKLKQFINCQQCGATATSTLGFHGTLSSTPNSPGCRHYDFNHGSWATNTGEHKGEERNSLAVAKFKGSWKLVLPNAYKTGYVFTGWYVKVANGTSGGETIPELGSGTWKYVGMAGNTWDLSDIVREHNTNVSASNKSPTGILTSEITTGVNDNLSGIKLHPRFEPIRYKILYVMNIPSSNDASTAHGTLQSHTLLTNPASLTNVHSLKYGGSDATSYTTNTASVGTTNSNHKDYSYIGTKTYVYDGSDWDLENMPITVNDYYFTGWTYDDIVWTGYGGMQENGVVLGSTRIGDGILDTHDASKDYTLKTLTMNPNVVQNILNNLPDTANSNTGTYKSHFTVPTNMPLSNPQSDGTNPKAGNQVSKLNIDNPTVYIVLKANWTDETVFEDDVLYDSNNDAEKIYTQYDAFDKFTDYIGILNNQKDQAVLGDAAFGKAYGSYIVDSKDTAVGDTSNDGSYDYNATSDRFVVKANSDKYYSGVSNGRNGFFSFQGWSAWKYATWRDAIDSNKKDTDTSELQFVGAASGKPLGHDGYSIDSSFTSGALTMRRYNDVTRQKRVGDLFYRMAAVLYPKSEYNSAFADTNRNGQMLNANGTGENYKPTLSEKYWDTYQWRWAQGTTGHYAIPVKGVLDEGIHLYAIWDAYPTSHIENTYVYLSDIATLTPDYLFSKVTAYDFEDFWNQKNYAIGETYGNDGVDWGEVAYKDRGKNYDSHNAGSYTYTYNIKGDEAYMKGKFTATLVDYDYSRFQNATFVDDIASVSMTFKFVDSAGNTTYKTAWIYIIDEDDTEREQEADANDPDNTRYSLTRFISKEFYEKAEFDANGNYIIGSADESAGSLLVRSKWYLNNSYKDQLLSAFDRLENVGDSNMRIDANILDLWGGKARYVNEDGSEHQYHPQLLFDETTGGLKWHYPWDNLKTQTEGVYILDYDDILKTKQFILEKNLDTGNYSGDTLSEYISEIFGNTAAKDSNGNALRIND